MATEIERKFIVDYDAVSPLLANGVEIQQGYFSTDGTATIRVRIADQRAYLTIKGRNSGISRSEFEYPIPVEDAKELIAQFCPILIHKTRYLIPVESHTFEVDIFYGDNQGLFMAEVELSSEREEVTLPHWIVQEVSGDPRFYNSALLTNPYKNWSARV